MRLQTSFQKWRADHGDRISPFGSGPFDAALSSMSRRFSRAAFLALFVGAMAGASEAAATVSGGFPPATR